MSQQKLNILLVEDDVNMGDMVKDALEESGFSVTLCRDGKDALSTFIKGSFNLCVFDVMLPQMDGFTLSERIRKLQPEIPFMFLTAKTETEDKLKGFELGADDYLIKPFSLKELIMRINVIARRLQSSIVANDETTVFNLGKLVFDYAKRELGTEGKMERISSKEADLLRLFCLNMNKMVRRDVILRTVWGSDDYFSSKSMDVYISRLRKLLKSEDSIQIINIHGTGYRFLVPNAEDEKPIE